MSIPRRPLGRTGLEVSVVGYGASALGAVFDSNLNLEEGICSVHEAFRLGVNLFDTSPFYGIGKSEENLGRALKDLPRSEIVVSTKVGRYGPDAFDFSAETVTKSINTSLERLHVDYIDILYCHDIEFVHLSEIRSQTIPAMLKAKEAGLVRHIGITGLPLKIYPSVLDNIAPGSVDVILSYCRNTLLDDTLIEMLPYLKGKQVGVINASPMAMGLLTPSGPPEWHPASQEIKDACNAASHLCTAQGISLPKLALFESIQNEDISSTLISMPTIAEVRQNLETATLQSLSEAEEVCLADVRKIFAPVRNQTWASGLQENN